MFVGTVYSYCSRCWTGAERTVWGDLRHDFRCWGPRVALHNLWHRVRDNDWVREEDL